jgi:glycosyltransferase involved in cell wall biosynthesis
MSSKKIKVISFLNSFTGASGGDTRFVEIMKCLREKSAVDLMVVTCDLGRSFCEERGLKGIFKLTTHENKITNKANAIIFLFFKRILSSLRLNLKIDNDTILYSAYQFLPDVFPVFILKRRKNMLWVQTLYHLVPSPKERDGSFLRNFFAFNEQKISFALIKRHADLIFVLNTVVKNQLVKLGFSENRIYVTGAGVDLSKIGQIQSIQGAHYDACFLGRLHPSKGVFDLPEIWKLVISRKKDAKLAIIYVGSKEMETILANLINKKNLISNISMLSISGKDALSVVKSSSIFIFPSHEEGWGIAICEAMACGLPVVAYDLPAYREIYKQGIVVVPLKDIKSFSNEVISLLEDDVKRNILAEKARLQVNEYDWETVSTRELLLMRKKLGECKLMTNETELSRTTSIGLKK